MKKRLILFSVLLLQASPAFAKYIVLSAFMNPPKETRNASAPIAQKVKEILIKKGHRVNVCIVGVVYDEAAQNILNCIGGFEGRPEIVISLGEAGPKIELEQAAYNTNNSSYKDANGEVRTNEYVDRNLPQKIEFNYPLEKMIRALQPSENAQIEISSDPDAFVCNNTAFWLAHLLPASTIYGFIHVPTVWDNTDFNQDALIIAKMIDAI